MNKNIKIAKELVKIAKMMVAGYNVTVKNDGKSNYSLTDKFLNDVNESDDVNKSESDKKIYPST